MNAEEFDKQVDHGENIIDDLDLARAQRPGEEQPVNADIPPTWLSATREANRKIGHD